MGLKLKKKKHRLTIKILPLKKAKGYYTIGENFIEVGSNSSKITFLSVLIHEYIHFIFDNFIEHKLSQKQEEVLCLAMDGVARGLFDGMLNNDWKIKGGKK